MRLARLVLVTLISALCAAAGMPREAAAWGPEGHRLIAIFADHVMQQNDPEIRKKVLEILATDKSNSWTKSDIGSEATWADVLRAKSEEARSATAAWHDVNFKSDDTDLATACNGQPPLPPGYPASHGPQEDCIVDKIDQFAKELHDPNTSAGERLLALQFLLNLVADLHDPLHAIDHDDQHGRCTAVSIGKGKAPTRLSTYWGDTLVFEVAGHDAEKGAAHIAAGITPADLKKWVGGDPAEWARGSFEIAKSSVYAFPAGAGPTKYTFPAGKGEKESCSSVDLYQLDASYETRGLAVVKEQLAKAGVHLAIILRDNLK